MNWLIDLCNDLFVSIIDLDNNDLNKMENFRVGTSIRRSIAIRTKEGQTYLF